MRCPSAMSKYAHFLFYRYKLERKIRERRLARKRRHRAKRTPAAKMNTLNKLIEDSVKQHYEDAKNREEQERNSQKSCSSNGENNLNKNNNAAGRLSSENDKTGKRKRKKDDESTDEDEMPRRRAMTMGQHKKRKRATAKYQKGLEMERKDEKRRAEVFDLEYSDSLKDFCVDESSMLEDDESSMLEDDEMSEKEAPKDVYTTSSFLSKGAASFLDDEAEENDSEIEVKGDFSDSEEERMYMKHCGLQSFYDENDGEFSSDDIEELSDDSADFRRRVRRKRNQFVFEEVDVEEDGESLGSDTEGDLEGEDNGSDLDSFIVDNHEPTILEETDEEETTGLDSSLFYKKQKRNRVLRFDDSDVEETEQTEIADSSTCVESSACVESFAANENSLSVLPSTSKSPQNSPKKENSQKSALDSPKNVQDLPTIILDSSVTSKVLPHQSTADEDDSSSDEIIKRQRSRTLILNSSSDEAGVTDIMCSEEETERDETGQTNEESVEQSVLAKLDNSKISNYKENNSNDPKFSSDDESDLDSLNNPKRLFKPSNARKVIISDEEDSIECVFTENEDDAMSSKSHSDDFELNEEDLDDTLMIGDQ